MILDDKYSNIPDAYMPILHDLDSKGSSIADLVDIAVQNGYAEKGPQDRQVYSYTPRRLGGVVIRAEFNDNDGSLNHMLLTRGDQMLEVSLRQTTVAVAENGGYTVMELGDTSDEVRQYLAERTRRLLALAA